MTIERKKEVIYVCASLTTAVCGLTWIQMAYNDPSVVKAWDWGSWKVILGISAFFVINQTLITWLAYMSDPTGLHRKPRPSDPPPEHKPPEPPPPTAPAP